MMAILISLSVGTNVFAETKSDVNFFLEKIATMEDEGKKELGVTVLKTYLDQESPDIESLKNIIKITATSEDIKKLEEKGYDLDTALDSLDIVEAMSREDVQNLIASIEKNDVEKMKEIVKEYTGSKDSEKSSTEKASDVEKVVEKEEENKGYKYFKDTKDHWAKEDIDFLTEQGIVKGEGEEIFNPDKKINRAEFTALIIRIFDLKAKEDIPLEFKDVEKKDWFYDVVKIGKENEIIHGIEKETFAPYKEITREEMVTMIMRAIEIIKEDPINQSNDLSIESFQDKEDISPWATNSVNKAIKLQIIKGKNENRFDAKGGGSRGEAAAIIRRVFDLLNKR